MSDAFCPFEVVTQTPFCPFIDINKVEEENRQLRSLIERRKSKDGHFLSTFSKEYYKILNQ